MLYAVHMRCCQARPHSSEELFGRNAVVLCGDTNFFLGMQQDRTANDEFPAQLKRLAVGTWCMDNWNAWLERCYDMLSEERSLFYKSSTLLCARIRQQ